MARKGGASGNAPSIEDQLRVENERKRIEKARRKQEREKRRGEKARLMLVKGQVPADEVDEDERAALQGSFGGAQPSDADLMLARHQPSGGGGGGNRSHKPGHMNAREKESLERDVKRQQERQQRYYSETEKNQKSLAPNPHMNPQYDDRSRTREDLEADYGDKGGRRPRSEWGNERGAGTKKDIDHVDKSDKSGKKKKKKTTS